MPAFAVPHCQFLQANPRAGFDVRILRNFRHKKTQAETIDDDELATAAAQVTGNGETLCNTIYRSSSGAPTIGLKYDCPLFGLACCCSCGLVRLCSSVKKKSSCVIKNVKETERDAEKAKRSSVRQVILVVFGQTNTAGDLISW